MNVVSLFHAKQITNHLSYKIGSNVMNTQIDLLSLCGVLGFEAIQNMFDANMINREQLEHVSYMWKQANKETYKIVLKSFNDGNNEWEEVVYINIKSLTEIEYHHTQAQAVTFEQVIDNKDKRVADKMISALNTVVKMRKQFKMTTSTAEIMIKFLSEQI